MARFRGLSRLWPFGSGSMVAPHRLVYANDPLSNEECGYPTNRVTNTKYSWWNFIPKNLLEQFSLHINRYFLLIALLQLWHEITPVDPLTTWGPLLFVFTVSGVKEAYDDWGRYQRDHRANRRRVTVLRDGKRQQVMCKDVLVGDIVYVIQDEEIPSDLVVLVSSDPSGCLYLQTANLDGETDFKVRQCLPGTQQLGERGLSNFNGVVECAHPNPEIYKFESCLRMSPDADPGDYLALTHNQTILQATHLKNTDWVYGLAVYTGNETKVGMNKRDPPCKLTKADTFINQIAIFIFCFQLCIVVAFGLTGSLIKEGDRNDLWYLVFPDREDDRWYEWSVIPLRFLLLCSFMIPISLKVTLDVVKLFYSKIISWDLLLYDAEGDIPATANSTAISEDLGQIQFILTDKTGTLTENNMVFKKCSIQSTLYGHSVGVDDAHTDANLQGRIERNDPHIIDFFRVLALCNTVVPIRNTDGSLSYRSSSPDEEALVRAASKFGIELVRRDMNTVELTVCGVREEYERLQVLEFSSDRKRMSVLLRNSDTQEIRLYAKGADDKIIARLRDEEDAHTTQEHLELFAKLGLRTLVIAGRSVDSAEYEEWQAQFHEANTALDDRQGMLAAVYETLERGLELHGATAIEDKLQEGVPATIRELRDAGLVFWMLTGDKYATAVQIAISCNLMPSSSEEHLLRVAGEGHDESLGTCIRAHYKLATQRPKEYTVIIEGHVLTPVLEHHKLAFSLLCRQANAVICCRVTPAQKALVVSMVKESGSMTLAIGDGGNDVSMIQEAHIGVGIVGKEGLQAARAADYSLGKFRYLKRLMLVHGRYSYHRTAFIAQYCFYKSLFICMIQLAYSFMSNFSGVSFFNSFSLMTYNVIFTGLPVVFYALDKDVSEETVMANPSIYRQGQKDKFLNVGTFSSWFFRATFQAIAVIVFTLAIYGPKWSEASGTPMDYDTVNMVGYTTVVMLQTLTIAYETNYWTIYNHLVTWGVVVVFFLVYLIYTYLPSFAFYMVMIRLYRDPSFWLAVIDTTIAAQFPVLAMKYVDFQYFPQYHQILQWMEHGYSSPLPRSNSKSSLLLEKEVELP